MFSTSGITDSKSMTQCAPSSWEIDENTKTLSVYTAWWNTIARHRTAVMSITEVSRFFRAHAGLSAATRAVWAQTWARRGCKLPDATGYLSQLAASHDLAAATLSELTNARNAFATSSVHRFISTVNAQRCCTAILQSRLRLKSLCRRCHALAAHL